MELAEARLHRRGHPRTAPPSPSLAADEPPSELLAGPAADTPAEPPASSSSGDAIEQTRRLGELRDAGLLTYAEFAAKKEHLLRRV